MLVLDGVCEQQTIYASFIKLERISAGTFVQVQNFNQHPRGLWLEMCIGKTWDEGIQESELAELQQHLWELSEAEA